MLDLNLGWVRSHPDPIYRTCSNETYSSSYSYIQSPVVASDRARQSFPDVFIDVVARVSLTKEREGTVFSLVPSLGSSRQPVDKVDGDTDEEGHPEKAEQHHTSPTAPTSQVTVSPHSVVPVPHCRVSRGRVRQEHSARTASVSAPTIVIGGVIHGGVSTNSFMTSAHW